jgi:hypothetical protein
MLVLAAHASAYVEVGTDWTVGEDWDYTVFNVELISPGNNTQAFSPVSFSAAVDCPSSKSICTMRLQLWNETGLTLNESWNMNVGCGEGGAGLACPATISLPKYYLDGFANNLTLNTGRYFWDIGVSPPAPWTTPPYFPDYSLYRNNLTVISSYEPNVKESGGKCFSSKAYYMAYNATNNNLNVMFDVSGLGSYVFNNTMANIWVEEAPYYFYANKQLLINTSVTKQFTIWVGGYNVVDDKAVRTTGPNVTHSLTMANFTQNNPAYWLTMRNESSGVLLDYSLYNQVNLKAFCEDYAPDTLNLKTISNKTLFLSTKENPVFQLETKNVTNNTLYLESRKITPDSILENISLYNAPTYDTASVSVVPYYFILQDYGGDYRQRGRLRIRTNINASIETIHSEPWYYDTLREIYLVNGTDYLIEVYIPGYGTESFGWLTDLSTGYKTLVITEKVWSEKVNHYKGVMWDVNWTYTPPAIGLTYNITTGGVHTATFTIWNYTNQVWYNNTLYTNYGSFAVALKQNQTFQYKFILDVENHSFIGGEGTINMLDTLVRISNIRLPDVMDIKGPKLENFFAYAVITMTMLIGGPANVMAMALLVGLELSIFGFMNWLGTNYWPYITATWALIALVIIAAERKKEDG